MPLVLSAFSVKREKFRGSSTFGSCVQRAGAFALLISTFGAQVDHRAHVQVIDEPPHVRLGQVLQVVGTDHLAMQACGTARRRWATNLDRGR